jgi:hypothetical protein
MPMNQTATQNAFSVTPNLSVFGYPSWPAAFSWSGNTMTWTLNASLAASTTYTVTVGTGAKSVSGNNLPTAKTFTFTTNAVPAVVSYGPQGNAVALSTDGKYIWILFNEAMNHTAAQAALQVYKTGSTPGPLPAGSFSWVGNGNEMEYTLANKLAAATNYTVKLGTGAKSAGGTARTTAYTWTFKTGISTSAMEAMTVAATTTNQGAEIVVDLSSAAEVSVTIRNVAGRVIALLQPGQLEAGMNTLLWNGKSATGTKVPSGTYLIEVKAATADGSSRSAVSSLQR